jgi:hypothetical protein
MLMPVGGCVSAIYGSRQAKHKVKSFVDESLDYLWIALGLAFVVLGYCEYDLAEKHGKQHLPIISFCMASVLL